MKVALRAETLLEHLALLGGRVPVPLAHVLGGVLLARSIIVAVELGIFDMLDQEPAATAVLAERCRADRKALPQLLEVLLASGYLSHSQGAWRLTRTSRKWLRGNSATSLRDAIRYQQVEAQWLSGLEQFVLTGSPLDFHRTMTGEQWGRYQRGMRAIAGLAADRLARSLSLIASPGRMLDIGGSHGYYSVALCRRHPQLQSVVLDLPQAIEHSAPLLAREAMGSRVIHRVGDALADDLGCEAWDLVLMAQLSHHFDEPTNRELVSRAVQALRPGGTLVIVESVQPDGPKRGGQITALLNLYFSFVSRAGLWSLSQLTGWQRDAGLVPGRAIRFPDLPGFMAQPATKPLR